MDPYDGMDKLRAVQGTRIAPDRGRPNAAGRMLGGIGRGLRRGQKRGSKMRGSSFRSLSG